MPFIAMVSSVGSNDEKGMYNYLGGVKNDKRSEELDIAFKQEKSNLQAQRKYHHHKSSLLHAYYREFQYNQ